MYPYDESETAPVKQDALTRLVQDPLYWREQDPEFRAYVDDGFKAVYGSEEAERDATGRSVEPAPKPVTLPPFKPSVQPEDASLAGGVGESQPNRWRDVWNVQKGLANTGHYALDLTREKSGEHTPALGQAIRAFQREKREEIDGTLLPGGPTITRLRESLLGGNQSSVSPGRDVASAIQNPSANALIRAPAAPAAPSGRSLLPRLPAIGGAPNADDETVVPAQAPGPRPPSPGGPQRPRTHREAEDRSMERIIPYPLIELPQPGTTRMRGGPLLHRSGDRRQSIIDGSAGRIVIRENPSANPNAPGYAFHVYGLGGVKTFDSTIEREAVRQGIDPDLIRAIVYVEWAHGAHYGIPPEFVDAAKSRYPMNIRPDLWSALGFAPERFKDEKTNIRAGVMLIRRIYERLEEPSVSKLATLYNSLAKDQVTDYGARVADVYRTKPWRRWFLRPYP